MKKKITVKYVDKNEDKRAYLQLIQEPICRMSTISAIFKGFAASIVAGISVIAYDSIDKWILLLSFVPVLSFCILDIYYLKLERRYKLLFKRVANGEKPCDFSMKAPNSPLDNIEARATTKECLKSPSINLFYPLMLAILIIVFGLKCGGVLQ